MRRAASNQAIACFGVDIRRCLLFVALAGLAGPTHATNGVNVLGPGAESVAMGSADLALGRDTGAINANPAGLTRIRHSRLDLYGAAIYATDLRHVDSLGNDNDIDINPQFIMGGGYARRLADSGVVLGFGLFSQGGVGFEYQRLNTAFGTRDDLLSLLGAVRLSPAIAWEVNDRLSLGLSVSMTYSALEQKAFPDTSYVDPGDPGRFFFGYRVDDLSGFHPGGRIGLQYRLGDATVLGLAYTSRTSLDMKGGRLVADLGAAGLGKVTYRDAEFTGLALPQEIGIGLSHWFSDRLLIAGEVNWVDWSRGFDTATLVGLRPDNPAAPAAFPMPNVLGWRDQTVVGLGLEYVHSDRLTLRAGYNYGRNPIPAQNLSPLLAVIAEHHLTGGAAYRFGEGWLGEVAVQYEPRTAVTYTNPALPFGADAKAIREGVFLYLSVSRIW